MRKNAPTPPPEKSASPECNSATTSAINGESIAKAQSTVHLPSHSCEGRNLRRRKAAGNCTITAFGEEIPAFAGMGRGERREFAGRRMRFRLSPEWRFFLYFWIPPNLVCPQRQKVPPFRRKPESPRRKARNSPPKKIAKKLKTWFFCLIL
ncbi:MAG: hypothetical protein ACR2QC_07295 [Gammaproteobacteria bacterium]